MGGQPLPDRLRWPAAAGGPPRRPARPRASSSTASSCLRSRRWSAAWRPSREMLIGARFVQGVGGALTSAVILGVIVTMFPEPARAGAGDRRLRLRGVRGRLARPAGRRRADRGDELALDFLRQPARSASLPRLRACGWSTPTAGIGLERGRRPAGAALLTGGLMLGVYTIVEVTDGWGSAHTVGFGASRSRCWPRSWCARHGREPADAAAAVPLAQRRRRQPRAGAAGRRHVRHVLPRRAVHAAHPRLRPARGRPGVPARRRS